MIVWLIIMLAALGAAFLEAALLGWILPDYRALKKGHRRQRIIIVPAGYRPELDQMPPQNHDMIFMTREDYERLHSSKV